jgi:hypothetical protein
MSTLLVQHTFNGLSGLPRDRFVNTFHGITLPEPVGAELEAVADAVLAFYDSTGTGLTSYLSPWCAGAGRNVKIYRMEDPKPRAPIFSKEVTATPPIVTSGTGFPNEVACCLSYKATSESGAVAARRRGRIYIGPLNTATGSITPPGDSRPAPAFVNRLLLSATTTWDALFAAGFIWCIWSVADDAPHAIASFSVDNAFDTQRRRGFKPTEVTTSLVGS